MRMRPIVRAVVICVALIGRASALLATTSSPTEPKEVQNGSVTLLGDAAAAVGDTTKGAAGIGIELAKPTWVVSALIKAGSTGSLNSSNPKDFWGELLFPVGGSASVTLDAKLYLSRLIWNDSNPFKWGLQANAIASKTNWAISSEKGGTSDSINLFAYGFGLTGIYDITSSFNLDKTTYNLALEGSALFSGRTFSGDGAFVSANTTTNAPNFIGAQVEFAIVINKVRAFVDMPFMSRNVPGISGTNLAFGIGVRGDLITVPTQPKSDGSSTKH
jgi:hypothetical protein